MNIVGGIGYILSLIPFLNIFSPILTGVAWFQAGSRTGQTLFRVTGILMIVSFLLGMGLLAVLLGTIFSAIAAFPSFLAGAELSEEIVPALISNFAGALAGIVVAALALGAVGIAVFFTELVSHFRAAKIFNSAWFSRAAWMRILTIVVVVVFIAGLVVLGLISPSALMADGADFMGGTVLLLILPAIITGLLANVFSAVAFFTAETPPKPA
ncbi:MAG: hypothetical protein RMI43_02035 [Candidatus Caldarchaeum sp.]|nr:hypothetical protein [Candidatus Caldarchaeum sp.]MCX8200914.1 hypothetical protein [Candidatus Caldarchaeum sp.]MDW8062932.1 hypothetical protein [Candidatus Caldarchaeum sp.]